MYAQTTIFLMAHFIDGHIVEFRAKDENVDNLRGTPMCIIITFSAMTLKNMIVPSSWKGVSNIISLHVKLYC